MGDIVKALSGLGLFGAVPAAAASGGGGVGADAKRKAATRTRGAGLLSYVDEPVTLGGGKAARSGGLFTAAKTLGG